MSQEVEIKLTANARDLPLLAESPVVGRFAAGPATSIDLTTVYYDTPDLAMARHGVSIRVRKRGRNYVQSVKGASSGSLILQRTESETVLKDSRPDLDAIDDDELREQALALAADGVLEPKWESAIRRTVRQLHAEDGDAIELAIDSGEIRAFANGDRRCAVSEIELELKRGAPAALYDAARALADVAPLTISTETKAERGLRALQASKPAAHKAGRLELPDTATAEEALRTVLLHCVRHIASNVPVVQAHDPDGLHQIRVGLRRLRAALSIFRPAVGTPALEELRARAKTLARSFAQARELDVFALELLPKLAQERHSGPDLSTLRAQLDELRSAAWAETTALVRSERFTAFLLDLSAAAETRQWRDGASADQAAEQIRPVHAFASDALGKAGRKSRKRAKHLSRLTTEERHELRISLKKLRYAAEFFASLFPSKQVSAYLKKMSKTQDIFGELNDIATAEHALERIVEQAGAQMSAELQAAQAFVSGWHAGRVEPVWRRAKAQWRNLAKADPFWA